MPTSSARAAQVREWSYHLLILALGIVAVVAAVAEVARGGGVGTHFVAAAVIGVPLIVVIARFPMVLDAGASGIEVGFDSSVLMFLLCTMESAQAVIVWSAGVLATQALSGKRAAARVFNIGVGIVGGALATVVYGAIIDGTTIESPRGLLAVALAAVTYFVTDYVLSAVAITLSSGSPLRSTLVQTGTVPAIACFVPLDSLGYLAAVVARATPSWTLILFGIPLVTLLIATRAVTRGRENARRLTVLFGAAGRAQSLADRQAVAEALARDAAELLQMKDVQIRSAAPAEGEIGVEVQLGEETAWVVARAAHRARATVTGDQQALRALAAVASDAMARIDLIDEMLHLARHDPLTDLPNRAILLDRVTQALERARESNTQTALLFLDLDGFKPVNDRFGHGAGDLVLVDIAGRLRDCVREGDTVARLGGDEFAVLVEDVDPLGVPAMCQRILAAVEEGTVVGGQAIRLGVSVGVAFDRGHDTAASLLRNADLAMYEAKAGGKGRCVEYQPAMGRARVDRLELIDDLRGAVEADQIEVVYQPVVQVATGRVVGAEALARWNRAGVPVPPDTFIGIAEETGLIIALGEAVLRRVGTDAAALLVTEGEPFSLSVNISAAQLRSPGFIDTVRSAARATAGMYLILEITERQGVDLTGEVLAVMRAIADLGVRFAIDDFGVGFSSISYLHELPARVIKADAALSANIDQDDRARGLLRSVMEMGRTLGFHVVIEGIERASQLDIICEDAPYSMVQGYLLHRPMPLADLVALLRSESALEQPQV
ncbi:EAL domain-containing protein [Nocardioides sp. BP30]|uniref:putative bifunctional diguanylate cyclase/phosphodiesterase n=1 Tax=Nocardioides sp. BP30 TaxID=3036374 RepID=UPI0024683ADF|nr:EAL domain-containing protein [Nocardioides sp. BP30]WGL51260.1 EAL domain-containing protein [Nocardioides sp. BP30]